MTEFLPLLFAAYIFTASSTCLAADANWLSLWYDKPAAKWEEALPIGNGRIGAMIFGQPFGERIQINEDTLWAGGPYDPVNPNAKGVLDQVRQLIFSGKFREATDLVNKDVVARPRGQMAYQTVGDLLLTFPTAAVADYRRDLNLDTAVANVRYKVGDVLYERQVFASAPDNVIVMRIVASKPGAISFTATMKTSMQATVRTEGNDTLVMEGRGSDSQGIKGQIKYEARVKMVARGGRVLSSSTGITVSDADEILLLTAAATSYKRFDDVSGDPDEIVKERLNAVAGKAFSTLLTRHENDYQRLFRRVSFSLGDKDESGEPTDFRIAHFADGNDQQLAALYYQYGRYLLISSSRPGGQPANLQGLWNQSMNPPWQSKYTININTEMNYWPAESGNLAECIQPLIKMVDELAITGSRTAQEMYGAHGWVAHHNTDIWRATAPIDFADSGMWPSGGAWLCLHLWDRYQFSGDISVLNEIYPVLKGSCEFFLDTLQEDPAHKWLVTNPSVSPENSHPGGALSAGPTMDMQILRDLFGNTIAAASILGVDADFQGRLASTRARLAPNQIGSVGQLQEWLDDWDMQTWDLHHRHVSHLYGLYPGHDISLRGTPQLAAAAKKSLEIRGDKSTGWATAWRLCLWSHLDDGDHAYQILRALISPDRTYPDMLDAHPPFQIDGNFGGAAGIAEMLMQSGDGEIELLPALPTAWRDGSIKGLRARGGFEVDITWKTGKLVQASVRSLNGGSATLKYGSATHKIALSKGEQYTWTGA